jgi:hypothetical protein
MGPFGLSIADIFHAEARLPSNSTRLRERVMITVKIRPPARRLQIGARRRHAKTAPGGVLVKTDALVASGIEIGTVV